MRPKLFSLALLLFGIACTTAPTSQQKAVIVSDLQAAVTAAAPLLGEGNGEYVAALQAVLDALVEGQEINWTNAFDAIHSLEPLVRSKLIAHGMKVEQADALLALTHIPLRHLELYLSEIGEPVNAPTTPGGGL